MVHMMTTVLFRVHIHTKCTMKIPNTDFPQSVTKEQHLGQTKTQAICP
jgi:hypothetical protein